jgi:hypothetical protein
MATKLKILGWSAKGLRCPDHDLSFEKEEGVYKISLVQMPNGTGKTTTLKLLRAALTGPEIWNEHFEPVQHFRKNDKTEKGEFELRLLHNDRRLTLLLQMNFITCEIKYITTSLRGKEVGFYPPIELKPFLSAEFVKLLVFDGELAAQLLDSKHTNAQKAIEEMHQLTFFPKMKERINEYWKEKAQEAGASGDPKQFTRRSTRVANLNRRIEYVKTCKKAELAKLKEVTSTIDKLDTEYRQQIEKNKQDALKMAEAEAALKIAKKDLDIKAKELAIIMKNPVDFSMRIATSIYDLKESLDRAKLPGIAAREFFDEIAEESHCICGREIDDVVKTAIKTGAKKFLGSEEMNVLNAMKTDVRNKFPDGKIQVGDSISNAVKALEEAQNQENIAQQTLDTVRLNAGVHNPEVEKIRQQIDDLNRTRGELEKGMKKYEERTDDSDESWNLDILKRREKEADDELANTTGTLEQKKKKDILDVILDKALQKSRYMLSESICVEANKKIQKLMPHNNIRIDVIDRSLRLAGKEGGSVGETLTVGYAFLSSLLTNTEHSLPSVVDSPSGPIDLKVRPEIGRLIPKLADQFIAFTISSERQNFIDPLVNESAEEVHFVTLFKKGDRNLEDKAKKINGFAETEDGICVPGKEYFEDFHTEIE